MPKPASVIDDLEADIAQPSPRKASAARTKKPAPSQASDPTPVAPAPRRRATAQTQRASAYLTQDQFEDLRAAYVTDLTLRGAQAPNSVGEWVTDALRHHNSLTPSRRQRTADQLPPTEGKRGARSWPVPLDVLADTQEAIAADLAAAGTVHSTASYLTDAVRAATERTRRANGGTLTPAPDGPLPKRAARIER